jgi:hypothetical protein
VSYRSDISTTVVKELSFGPAVPVRLEALLTTETYSSHIWNSGWRIHSAIMGFLNDYVSRPLSSINFVIIHDMINYSNWSFLLLFQAIHNRDTSKFTVLFLMYGHHHLGFSCFSLLFEILSYLNDQEITAYVTYADVFTSFLKRKVTPERFSPPPPQFSP